MPYFDQKHNPLSQLTPSLDPDSNKDSQNTFTVTRYYQRNYNFCRSTLKTRLLPPVFSLRLISRQKQLGHYPQAFHSV